MLHAGIEEADVNSEGLTTAEIVQLLSHPVGQDGVDGWPVLRTAIAELCGAKFSSKSVGYGLRRFKERVCAGKRLECRAGHGGVKRWFIESIGHRPGADSQTPTETAREPAVLARVAADGGDDVEVF